MSMEASEVTVNLKEIENDLKKGLLNAEFNTNETVNIPEGSVVPKSTLNLGSPVVKVFCRLKNGIQFRMVTKNLPEDIKSKLRHFSEVEDREVVVYKTALDLYGQEYLSPELIELINKYANSPLAPLIEYEYEKFNMMKAEVTLLLKEPKKSDADAN